MWFPGYQGLETAAFVGDYYLSGDTVELNEDGSISFVGRADDVITTSGYRVGPFDVESALIEHPAVMEAAVIGKPDPARTELVKAFVVLCAGHRPTPELADELQRYVRQRLSAHAYPREIEFLEELPKTPAARSSAFSCATRRSPGNARRPHRRPPRTDSAGENDVRIENRVFLVTGGSSGLGAATAKMLVEQGGKVVLADINAEAGAAKAAELGAQARFVRADIASEADGRQAVATALEAFGGLHGLANCAGVAPAEKVLGRNGIHALESFRRVIDINLVGSFNMLRLAAEAMSQASRTRAASAGDRQYRLGGGVRRADRPGRLFRLEERGGRHDPAHRPRAGALRHPSDDHRPGHLRDTDDGRHAPGGARLPRRQRAVPAAPGASDEYAALVRQIIENSMLNGEVIRLDGAIRMAAR